METKVKYSNLSERQAKIEEYEAQTKPRDFDIVGVARDTKLMMLHDDFDDPNWKHGDPILGTMTFTDVMPPVIPVEPPRSTHVSTLEAVNVASARPARIKRAWEGKNYFYDCFATQTVKDEFQAGKIVIGDYVLVHFDNIGEQIVTAKVYKSWV